MTDNFINFLSIKKKLYFKKLCDISKYFFKTHKFSLPNFIFNLENFWKYKNSKF